MPGTRRIHLRWYAAYFRVRATIASIASSVGSVATSSMPIVLRAVAAATHGEGDVVVHFPGGDLRVRLEGGQATLTGPAEKL